MTENYPHNTPNQPDKIEERNKDQGGALKAKLIGLRKKRQRTLSG